MRIEYCRKLSNLIGFTRCGFWEYDQLLIFVDYNDMGLAKNFAAVSLARSSDIKTVRTKIDAETIRDRRIARKENQREFWSRFGVTQTRGSRFEMGQNIPPPVKILLRLYFDGVINDGDLWRARRRRSLDALGI